MTENSVLTKCKATEGRQTNNRIKVNKLSGKGSHNKPFTVSLYLDRVSAVQPASAACKQPQTPRMQCGAAPHIT